MQDLNKKTTLPYNDFGSWIRSIFPFKIQKISVDAGFSCPNRDAESATADVPFATTAHSILLIATRTKLLRSSLKKERCFFATNIPKCAIWHTFRHTQTRMGI